MTENNIKIGYVVSNYDTLDGNRVKVRIKGDDDKKLDSELDYAFPLLPKTFLSTPKEGEGVIVFDTNPSSGSGDKFYIGPIISQTHKLEYDPLNYSGMSLLNYGLISPEQPFHLNKNSKGVYPENEDIAIQGRYNSDIILKNNELRIRCGQKNDKNEYNANDLAYIQLKYDVKTNKDVKSCVNIVGDSINLISHKSSKRYNTTDPENLISDSELTRILNTAYSLPYGEVLVDVLKTFITAFISHSHPYDNMSPNNTFDLKKLKEINLESILSESIKIN